MAYTLGGNKLFAIFLILTGVGWDGLDGFFSRRSARTGGAFGRIADSCSDAITFGLAPGALVAVNTFDRSVWAPWDLVAFALAAALVATAWARLVFYTARAYRRPHFLGASTPQNAMWVACLVLLFQTPGFLLESPAAFFALTAAFVPLMVLPLRYPKLRKGAPLRSVVTGMAGCLSLSVILLNVHGILPGALGVPVDLVGFALVAAATGLLLFFYLVGPWWTPREAPGAGGGEGSGGTKDAATKETA